uniref:Uncharacterized protein n=1 Tax=Pygocentrus nattereri TaxID=42514 RepID=A0AAR2JY61_PYGNA
MLRGARLQGDQSVCFPLSGQSYELQIWVCMCVGFRTFSGPTNPKEVLILCYYTTTICLLSTKPHMHLQLKTGILHSLQSISIGRFIMTFKFSDTFFNPTTGEIPPPTLAQSSGQPYPQHPGSSWGLGVLLKDTSVMDCQCWGSNRRPSGHRASSQTSSPRLPPYTHNVKDSWFYQNFAF